MAYLPTELWIKVLSSCDALSTLQLASASRYHRQLHQSSLDSVWHPKVVRLAGFSISTTAKTGESSYDVYRIIAAWHNLGRELLSQNGLHRWPRNFAEFVGDPPTMNQLPPDCRVLARADVSYTHRIFDVMSIDSADSTLFSTSAATCVKNFLSDDRNGQIFPLSLFCKDFHQIAQGGELIVEKNFDEDEFRVMLLERTAITHVCNFPSDFEGAAEFFESHPIMPTFCERCQDDFHIVCHGIVGNKILFGSGHHDTLKLAAYVFRPSTMKFQCLWKRVWNCENTDASAVVTCNEDIICVWYRNQSDNVPTDSTQIRQSAVELFKFDTFRRLTPPVLVPMESRGHIKMSKYFICVYESITKVSLYWPKMTAEGTLQPVLSGIDVHAFFGDTGVTDDELESGTSGHWARNSRELIHWTIGPHGHFNLRIDDMVLFYDPCSRSGKICRLTSADTPSYYQVLLIEEDGVSKVIQLFQPLPR